MKIQILSFAMIAAMGLLTACGGEEDTTTTPDSTEDTTAAPAQNNEPDEIAPALYTAQGVTPDGKTVSLVEATIDAEFPDAMIDLLTPEDPQVGANIFNFDVINYSLASETPGWKERDCANSAKGQHIHYIRNNEPYKAKYVASFEEELSEGENVILAFISRSYHESIKHQGAAVIKNYYLGDGESAFVESGEHLFYSRPKGNYSLAESNRILLDFYLLNVDLAEKGYMVRVIIDGAEFQVPSWKPYFIGGLEAGEHTCSIELIDGEGNRVPGPYNFSGERTFTVTEG